MFTTNIRQLYNPNGQGSDQIKRLTSQILSWAPTWLSSQHDQGPSCRTKKHKEQNKFPMFQKKKNIKTSCCWYSWGGSPAHSWSLSPKHWRSRSGEKGFQSSFGEKNMIIEIEFNRKVGQSDQRLVEKWKYLKSQCQIIAEVLIQLVL